MRRINQEITAPYILEEILINTRICRIGWVDENGWPYVLPFNYGYKDHQIYIHCAREGKKISLLRKNPHVCFELEEQSELVKHEKACNWATNYRSIVGYGTIEMRI